ncbi:MAG: zf-HC2 domain-containing protein [Clostridiales bacterium]|jgi:predicted anti-sigma-YlaC factor YlaD|nr:zf-HC2 domain-containing protein [Clostridiales bacterium]
MNMPCEIVKDLLPLYLDGVCSDGSRAAVEEHLAACDGCAAELRAMRAALPIGGAEQNLKEAEAVKSISKRWRKGMAKSLLKGVLCTILAVAVLALVAYVFADFRIVF